jgi:hypothetical protein
MTGRSQSGIRRSGSPPAARSTLAMKPSDGAAALAGIARASSSTSSPSRSSISLAARVAHQQPLPPFFAM